MSVGRGSMCCKAVRGSGASVVFFALDNHLQGD